MQIFVVKFNEHYHSPSVITITPTMSFSAVWCINDMSCVFRIHNFTLQVTGEESYINGNIKLIQFKAVRRCAYHKNYCVVNYVCNHLELCSSEKTFICLLLTNPMSKMIDCMD